MIEESEIKKVLELHEQAFQLFRWLNQRFREGNPPFKKLDAVVMYAPEAKRWMEKNYRSFPKNLGIDPRDFDPLAHLFASYLASSFEIAEGYMDSSHGCGPSCSYCSFWVVNKHLRRRNVRKKDKELAQEIKQNYVQQLAKSVRCGWDPKDWNRVLQSDKSLERDVTIATYGFELIRRSKFNSQGGANLALWREMVPKVKRWGRRKPPQKFPLIPRTFLEAENNVTKALISMGLKK